MDGGHSAGMPHLALRQRTQQFSSKLTEITVHCDVPVREAEPVIMRRTSFAQRCAEYFEMSGPGEFIAVAVLFALMLVIRLVNIKRYAFDSDEPQHLHVIWGWTRGFVQYRNLFDNHMPLFQIMFAPIFGLIGERATILYLMRFIMLPMYFVAAWCTYRIGASVFSKRVGVWAVILAGLYARYHLVSLEFRPDNLWAPLWLLCISVLVGGPLTVRRALMAGLCLGMCFGLSMKSVLFLVSIGLAAPLTLLLVGRRHLDELWPNLARCVAAFLISTSLVPIIIMGFFALKGVWRDFRYCVFDFNLLAPGAEQHSVFYKVRLALIVTTLIVTFAYVAWRVTRVSDNAGLAFRRGFLLIVCASYFLMMQFFWPLSRHDNYPPLYPLAAVLCCGALIAFLNALPSFGWKQVRILRSTPLLVFLALGETAVLVSMEPIWKDRTHGETDLLRNTLGLLGPGDYVLDLKGETVFRRRCVRPIFEAITRSAIERGILLDNVPQACVQTRTCAVATLLIKRFSRGTREFVKRNYVPVTSSLRIAGAELKASATSPGRCEFNVTIPAEYELISRAQDVSGTLDGVPYNGARFLAAGPHTFESTSISRDLILLWAQAADRHFTPFEHHTSSF
jgi:hypothetical protein